MSDTGYPEVVGIDAAGNIIAQGLDLQASGSSTPPNQDRIRWLRPSDNADVADIYALDIAGVVQLYLQAYLNPPDTEADIIISAGAGKIILNSLLDVQAAADSGLVVVTVIDQNAKSSFPQLPAAAKKVYIDFTASETWAGGVSEASVAFTHGQPTPAGAFYQAIYIDSSGATAAFTQIRSPALGGCTVDVQCTSGSPPAGTPFGLYILTILTY